MAEVAGVLSFSASINNDKVGAIFFSDTVEKFIPPKKGRSHLLRIIRELLEFKPESQQTNVSEALRYLTNALKKRCTAFLLSDLIDLSDNGKVKFAEALKIAANKHDLAAIRLYDPREASLPKVGLMQLRDAETGKEMWIDTSSRKVRTQYESWWRNANVSVSQSLAKCRIDNVQISTAEDYVKPLIRLFERR
jgi:uncharacterized protein (DUF58 family)